MHRERVAAFDTCRGGVTSSLDDSNSFATIYSPTQPGIAYAFFGAMTRSGGSPFPLADFTVAAQLVAKNGPGVNQWAFGVAAEAWAQPGSRSILVGLESAVINEGPTNAIRRSPTTR